jgi:putative hemolysin
MDMHTANQTATPSEAWISGLLGPKVAAPIRKIMHNALRLGDLDRLYLEAGAPTSAQQTLSAGVLRALEIELSWEPGDIERFPKTGPLIAVANHPCGLLDGLLLDVFLSKVRPETKIVANRLLCSIPEISDRFFPVEVLHGEAEHSNSQSLRKVVRLLREGGAIAMFPAGEVAHWKASQLRVTDSDWNENIARIVALTNATVVPLYFPASNGMAFQLAGLVHPMLRTIRLPAELLNKRRHQFEIRVGTPVPASALEDFESSREATEYLRSRTYILEHRRAHAHAATAAHDVRTPAVLPSANEQARREARGLLASGTATIVEGGKYQVLLARGKDLDALLTEIGRAREIAFRASGEGTSNEIDLDRFDSTYSHLVLWDRGTETVAGGYRLAWTRDILPSQGTHGLYTNTLFRFKPYFFERLGPAVELGRSFVRPEYQREFQPLMLLWQAIGRCVSTRPDAPVLFGAVSVSASYTEASRALIAAFLSRNRFDHELAGLVKPRRPFRARPIHEADLRPLLASAGDIEDLNGTIRDIEEDQGGLPVLIRQYLKLGGRIAAWSVDEKFSGVLDGLVIVNLRNTDRRVLEKYMGREGARQFLEINGKRTG